MTRLERIRNYTLWGMGNYAIHRGQDPQVIIDNLIWRLTQIRALAEEEVGPNGEGV